MRDIYYHGRAFGESGKLLIESGSNNLFVPGIINICLSVEIFLKSINASMTFLEDKVEMNDGHLYQGREGTLEILPGGKGHALSKLFDGLPHEIQAEIANYARHEGYAGCVSKGLKKYDDVFVEWRYIYERTSPESLGTHPLFEIANAISGYCEKNLGEAIDCIAIEA